MRALFFIALSAFLLFTACAQEVDKITKFSALQNQKLYAFKPGCLDTLSWIYIKNDTVIMRKNYWHPGRYRLDRLSYTHGGSLNRDSLYLFIHKEEYAFGQDTVFQEMLRIGKYQDWVQRVWVKPRKDELLFVYQKPPIANRPGHENVFSSVRLYVKDEVFNGNAIKNNEIGGKFILPDGFTGRGLIALNQADGLEPEFDTNGIPIYRIGKDGLLSTKHPENPTMIAKGTYKFYFIESEEQILTEIPVLFNDCRQLLAHEYRMNGKLLGRKYKLDELYVITRYNPAPNVIDEAFGKSTLGNVIIFQVDTLKNFLLH